MQKKRLVDLLKRRVLVLDGAMGTEIQKEISKFDCPEILNITNPRLIQKIHKDYFDAGSDIIITNTFGANKFKLKKFGFENRIKKINEAAVKNAKKHCSWAFIAGGIGPLGDYIQPIGKISFDDAVEAYIEQASYLKKCDIIIIETISDIKNLKAAIIGIKEVFKGPIICSMTFDGDRTSTGTNIKTFVSIVESLDVDIIGINCSNGPKEMLKNVKELSKYTSLPICVEPNAGIPKLVNKKTVWDFSPELFGKLALELANAGANIIGGCCGTNPDFIREIKNNTKKIKPKNIKIKPIPSLSSRTSTLDITSNKIVGERINPTNRYGFISELKKGNTEYISAQSLQQVEEGANLIDINVGYPGIDENSSLIKAVKSVSKSINNPIVIDTQNTVALENALKEYAGKALINSFNGSKKSLENMYLAKKYGASIIGICVDELGVPENVEKRLSIAKKIIKHANDLGINNKDIFIDPVVMSKATNSDIEKIIIESIKKIKKLNVNTITGVSNISHGLPSRHSINHKFYLKLKKNGLDLAIMNPIDTLMVKDENIINIKKKSKSGYTKLTLKKQIRESIIHGWDDVIEKIIIKAKDKYDYNKINEFLASAMDEVGKMFKAKKIFLPNVLSSASAMKKAHLIVSKMVTKRNVINKKVLFATVENDIHDLGKNIVITLLESHGIDVIDLGINVKTKSIITAAKKIQPDIIALSALMTTTASEMERIISLLHHNNINIPIVVGGAVITNDFAKKIGAIYAKDGISAVKKIRGVFNLKKKFTISAEIVPPKNSENLNDTLDNIKKIKGHVDFISVTKHPQGAHSAGTIPISLFSQSKLGIDSVPHIICRGYTHQEIESELVDLHNLGITNVVAIRGDPTPIKNNDGDKMYTCDLIAQIDGLKNGLYQNGKGKKLNFKIYTSGYPNKRFTEELKYLQKKVIAGADAIITQVLFSPKRLKVYIERLKKHGITLPVIAGLIPIHNQKQASVIKDHFKVNVSTEGLESKKDFIKFNSDIAKEMIKSGASGIHLFHANDTDFIKSIIKEIR